MNSLHKVLLACVPMLGLAACGGGDTADRLDLADPVVRFVDASENAPNLTLSRGGVARADATNVSYLYASDYFNVDTSAADWSVKAAAAGTMFGTVPIDPVRGNRYTIVALPASLNNTTVALISDPYNKSLTSDSTRLRFLNASYNADSIDVYVNAPGTSIAAAGVNPKIAATAFKTAGPASGQDSVDVPGGNYQVTMTIAGSKTVLFQGLLSFAANKDVLLMSVPGPVLPLAIQPTDVKALVKIEGTAGATEIARI